MSNTVVQSRDQVGDIVFEIATASHRDRTEPSMRRAAHAVKRFQGEGKLVVGVNTCCVRCVRQKQEQQ